MASFLRRLTTWHCSHLLPPPNAVPRRICCCVSRQPPLSIDISCPPGLQQQTHRSGVPRSIDGADWLTDGRTRYRYLDAAAYHASSDQKRTGGCALRLQRTAATTTFSVKHAAVPQSVHSRFSHFYWQIPQWICCPVVIKNHATLHALHWWPNSSD